MVKERQALVFCIFSAISQRLSNKKRHIKPESVDMALSYRNIIFDALQGIRSHHGLMER